MVAPVALPSLRLLQSVNFEPRYFEMGDGEYGGAGQVAEYADPRWEFAYRLAGFPDRQSRAIWQAFLDGLRGTKVPVLAFDTARRVPLHYYDDAGRPLASGSPWGSPTVTAYSRANSTITLGNLTPGAVLGWGDYMSFQDGDEGPTDRWHLHRIQEGGTANGSGALTCQVNFRPARNLDAVGSAVRLRDACCTAILKWNPSDLSFGADNGGPMTVSGYQITRAFL